jgi:hypothetical protein
MAKFEEAKTLIDLVAGRSGPSAERARLIAFPADLAQRVREDRRRAAGIAGLSVAQG